MRRSKQAIIDELERTLKIEQRAYETQRQEFKIMNDKLHTENRDLRDKLLLQERLIIIIENLSRAKANYALPR